FFFFQAEDGIRDFHVTGVQTCALPISPLPWLRAGWRGLSLYFFSRSRMASKKHYVVWVGRTPGIYDNWHEAERQVKGHPGAKYRSEERRVGKECRSRRSSADQKERKDK